MTRMNKSPVVLFAEGLSHDMVTYEYLQINYSWEFRLNNDKY